MKLKLTSLLLVIVLITILVPRITLANATLVVNTTADENGTGSGCSLREAITAANNNSNYGGCIASGAYGTDTISFNPAIFSTAQTITLSERLPDIITSMNITGPGANLLTISGNDAVRVFYINGSLNMALSGVTITHGHADYGGGINLNYGILTVSNSVITGNLADQQGGGILNQNGNGAPYGTLIVINSTISGNSAGAMGGGLYSVGTLIVSGSTISGNTSSYGGGVYGAATITNSTISGNAVTEQGGAIYTPVDGALQMVNTTVSHNNAAVQGGQVYVESSSLVMFNSIVAYSNNAGDCVSTGTVTISHSLIEDGSCGITSGVDGNLTGDPLLGTLANNGGLTQTIALPGLVPAFNAGDNSYLNEATSSIDFNGDGDTADSLTTDQRGTGYNRIVYSTVDMGAVESTIPTNSLVVDTTSDDNLNQCSQAGGDCSLRGAITIANIIGGAPTITFDPTVFSSPQIITLNSALPSLSQNMTIDGGTAGYVTINGNHLSSRIFFVNSGITAALQNLILSDSDGGAIENRGTLTVFNTTFTNNKVALSNGGGIYNNTNSSTLRVINSTLTGGYAYFGGGVYNSGTAYVINTTITGNSGIYYGGLLGSGSQGSLTMINSTVSDNFSKNGPYPGFWAYTGTARIYNSIISNNHATGSSVGQPSDVDCYSSNGPTIVLINSLVQDGSCGVTSGVNGNLTGDPLLNPLAYNGGLTQTYAPVTISPVVNRGNNSYLSEATLNADLNGDGDTADSLTTDQRGAGYNRIVYSTVDMGAVESTIPAISLVVDTTSDDNLFQCTSASGDCSLRGVLTLVNVIGGAPTITFDPTVFSSPQIITLNSALPSLSQNMTIDGGAAGYVTISGNHLAGRIFIVNSGITATLQNLTLIDSNDGAVSNDGTLTILNTTISGNATGSDGGAIVNGASGILRLLNTTISGNSAQFGGGLRNNGTAYMVNSTISGNSVNSRGGAVRNVGTMTMINSTVSDNFSTLYYGGIEQMGTLKIYNSIIANNYVAGASADDPNYDVECYFGGAVTIFNTLIKDGSCGVTSGVNGNLTGDPLLNPLAYNGGLTQTYAPFTVSPVVNRGNNSYLSETTLNADLNGDGDKNDTLTTDQRGASYSRVNVSTVDMGAVEVASAYNGLVVDTISDDNLNQCSQAGGDCSLRGAITLANLLSGANTITFDPAVFITDQTITLTSTLPSLSDHLSINGGTAGRVTVSGNHLSMRIFTVNTGIAVTLQNLTLSDSNDGAIWSDGILTIFNTTISGNATGGDGGAIYTYSNSFLRLLNSTISGNSAQVGGGLRTNGTAYIVNSTISGNSVNNRAGAIFNVATLTMINSTITDNLSTSTYGGIYQAGTLKLYNSIIANNYVTGTFADDPDYDVECYLSNPTTVSNSLIMDGSCGVTNGVNGDLTGDPLLNPLAYSGGLTQTSTPTLSSPTVNAGNNSYLSEATLALDLNGDGDTADTLTSDQRGTGYDRIITGTVDMGAVEYYIAPDSQLNAAPAINYTTSNVTTLTWNQVIGATGYEVQIANSNAFSTLFCVGAPAPTGLSLTTCSLQPGTYYWRVRAVAGNKAGGWSAANPFTIGAQ